MAEHDRHSFFTFSRRDFIRFAGSSLALPALPPLLGAGARTIAGDDLALDGLAYDVVYTFVRREDLAYFHVCGLNLRETASAFGRKYLVANDVSKPSFLVLVLPPQHFGEQVDPSTNNGSSSSSWCVSANSSRVAVRVKVGRHLNYRAIAVDFHSILSKIDDAVLATVPAQVPVPVTTLIEAPTRLYLFPDDDTIVATAVAPRTIRAADHEEGLPPTPGTSDIEIWSVELQNANGLRYAAFNGGVDGSGQPKPDLFARMTSDENDPAQSYPLNSTRRDHLHYWSAVDDQPNRPKRYPLVSSVAKLTSYGAQLDLEWRAPYLPPVNNVPPDRSMTQYANRMELGRTAHESTTFSGYIYPYFVPAVYVTRVARDLVEGEAQLRSHLYVQLTRPDARFDGPTDKRVSALFAGNGLTLSPLTSPDLDTPSAHQVLPPSHDPIVPDAFFLYTKGGEPFQWRCAVDGFEQTAYGGDTPSIFVLENVFDGVNPKAAFDAIDRAWSDATKKLNEIRINRQMVAYARRRNPVVNAPNGDPRTTLVTTMIRYRAQYDATLRRFTPYIDAASAVVPAVSELTGVDDAVLVAFAEKYREQVDDLQGAAQAVLVPLQDLIAKLGGEAAQTRNAVASLQHRVIGISREYGAILGAATNDAQQQLNDLENQVVNAAAARIANLFDDASSKVLGLFPIGDLFQAVAARDLSSGLPTIVRQLIDQHTVEVKYELSAPISISNAIAGFVSSANGAFHVLASIRASLDSHPVAPPHIECSITGLELILPPSSSAILPGGLITIPLKKVKMVSDGGTPHVTVDLGTPKLGGVLNLISSLANSLGFGGDELRQVITDEMITMQTNVALPAIPSGAINFYNIALNFALSLPLDQASERATFAFGLSSHRNPFTITVGFLGGSGYMQIGLSFPDAKVTFAGSLALSAAAELDFGPIQGSAAFNAGLELTFGAGRAEITGYLNAWAAVSLFSIVSVSLSFEMKFTYFPDSGAFRGSVQVSVSVHVLFFSASADVNVSYTLGGSGARHTLSEQLSSRAFAASSDARRTALQRGEVPIGGGDVNYWKRYASKFA